MGHAARVGEQGHLAHAVPGGGFRHEGGDMALQGARIHDVVGRGEGDHLAGSPCHADVQGSVAIRPRHIDECGPDFVPDPLA